MYLLTRSTLSAALLVIALFFCSSMEAQNKVIDRKIQLFYSDYFGALDTGFTSVKNSSTSFLLDSAYSKISVFFFHAPATTGL